MEEKWRKWREKHGGKEKCRGKVGESIEKGEKTWRKGKIGRKE